jgi:hypothetical protein
MAPSKPDPRTIAYLDELAGRLAHLLGPQLTGVYAGGSLALGAYRPPRSDLDVAAVIEMPLTPNLRKRIVERLRHEALPCPARGLELVIYRRATAGSPTASREFELNLNTGSLMPLRVEASPGCEATHWYPIDRSILAQAGIAVLGPPAGQVFASIPPAELTPVLVESLRWHRGGPATAEDAVLNACRSLRFAGEGLWSSKLEAGHWAAERGEAPPPLVRDAIAALNGSGQLDGRAAERWLDDVLRRLEHDSARLRR